MTIEAILFDFDGTIADTQQAFFIIANDLALEFGYPQVNLEELAYLKQLSSAEVIKYSRIPPLKIPFILKRIKKELAKTITALQPYPAIVSCLEELKKQGYLLGIVTSNSKENVMAFLQKNDLADIFAVIHSGTTLFGKNRIINRVLREHQLAPPRVIYVGDETRDILAARKSHITMISVAWGFNSPAVLAEHHPDFLVYQPQELLQVIAELEQRQTSLPLI